jgi:DNA-directed RNA polymerase specialized sigma24 family protein
MPEIDARKLLAHAKDLSARYARRLGPEEAADLVAEALARGLERPPADGKMEPWLERIARNLMVDRWRRARVAERCPADSPEPVASPEDLVLAGERRRTLRRSLARLHRDQRRSILHRYFTAGPLPAGLSATTLRTRLHRGLGRLRELTRGLLALFPPVRLGHWLTLAANPALVAILLTAQQSPVAPPAPAPAPVQRRAIARQVAPLPPSPRPAAIPQPTPQPTPHPAPARPAVQRYDFDDDEVSGEIQMPDPLVVDGVAKVKHASLIEIPRDFVAAVAKSVEDL